MISKKEELKKTYRKDQFYRESILLINDFSNEVLGGELDRLKTYCFDNLKGSFKYAYPNIEQIHKWKFDCDDTKLSRAIYCVTWGYIFNLKEESYKSEYRGDTMNSFNTLFGDEDRGIFAYRARFYDMDKDIKAWSNIIKFKYQYHTIGNFIVLPNKGKLKKGTIDKFSGSINIERSSKFKDYFDLFLIDLDIYKSTKTNESKLKEFFDENSFYKEFSMSKMKEIFFLDDYFNGEEPKEFIGIPKGDRFKLTGSKEYRKNKKGCFSQKEYTKLVNEYIAKSEEVISNRADKIIDVLKEEIKEAKKIGIL
ncbi:MAG: hypothetical protein RR923_07050 [Bacilli bacterium]